MIVNQGGNLSPLLEGGCILFFTDRSLVLEAIDSGAIDATPYLYRDGEIFTIYYALPIDLLRTGDRDEASVVLNLLNTFDDFLIGLNMTIPAQFRSEIYLMADFLTFDKNLGAIFRVRVKKERIWFRVFSGVWGQFSRRQK